LLTSQVFTLGTLFRLLVTTQSTTVLYLNRINRFIIKKNMEAELNVVPKKYYILGQNRKMYTFAHN